MLSPIVDLHHVTAIASDPHRNLDFYTQVLDRFVSALLISTTLAPIISISVTMRDLREPS